MDRLRRLPVDLEDLILAIEDSSRADNDYYLNTETGDVVVLPTEITHAVGEDDWEEQREDFPQ